MLAGRTDRLLHQARLLLDHLGRKAGQEIAGKAPYLREVDVVLPGLQLTQLVQPRSSSPRKRKRTTGRRRGSGNGPAPRPETVAE